MERWRAVDGYEGRYEVSDLGRVRSLLSSCAMAQGLGGGYLGLMLSQPRKRFTVHSLVALAFIGPRPRGAQVNHKDGDKANNRAENLEYVTRSENMKHAHRIGLQSNKGECHSQAKLNDEKVREIRTAVADGVAQSAVARLMGVHQSAVSRVVNGRRWPHVSNDRRAG